MLELVLVFTAFSAGMGVGWRMGRLFQVVQAERGKLPLKKRWRADPW